MKESEGEGIERKDIQSGGLNPTACTAVDFTNVIAELLRTGRSSLCARWGQAPARLPSSHFQELLCYFTHTLIREPLSLADVCGLCLVKPKDTKPKQILNQ